MYLESFKLFSIHPHLCYEDLIVEIVGVQISKKSSIISKSTYNKHNGNGTVLLQKSNRTAYFALTVTNISHLTLLELGPCNRCLIRIHMVSLS